MKVKEKAIALLNEIINASKEIEEDNTNSDYIIKSDLHTEIFNFLQNNNLDKFEK
jgi:hypothetical protein